MDFQQQFNQVDQLLSSTRQYWQILPFAHLSVLWADNIALTNYLNSLSVADIDMLDSNDQSLRTAIFPHINQSLECLSVLPEPVSQQFCSPDRLKASIKGRKWQQIEQFESLVPTGKGQLLEWCAGKGHLGRLIGYHQQRPIVSVEWQQALCDQGQAMSDKLDIEQSFVQADVLSLNKPLIKPEHQVVALHACGDLHVELLKQAAKIKPTQLSVAPCCYHLINNDIYQALSEAGQNSELVLTKRDLNLATQKVVVAGQRVRQHRVTEVTWRLGFDLLQRHLRGIDQYLPLPSIRQSMLVGTFSQFCQWACDHKNLKLDQDLDLSVFEAAGGQRRIINARIEHVTHAFRQVLERWLLLDRVLYLQQHGYTVELSRFCQPEVTPRNIMINASIR